jgi:phosphatidylserine synthase
MSVPSRSAQLQHGLANVLTGCNLASGIVAMLHRAEGRPVRQSALILAGALCDTLDGALARRSGYATDLGAVADGFADVVTCGVAPAVVLASWESARRTRLARIAPRFYLLAVALRTAKYGASPRRSHVFRGLPVTGAGVLLAAGCQARLPRRALDCLAVALGVAMLSRIRVLSGEALIRRNMPLDIPAAS